MPYNDIQVTLKFDFANRAEVIIGIYEMLVDSEKLDNPGPESTFSNLPHLTTFLNILNGTEIDCDEMDTLKDLQEALIRLTVKIQSDMEGLKEFYPSYSNVEIVDLTRKVKNAIRNCPTQRVPDAGDSVA